LGSVLAPAAVYALEVDAEEADLKLIAIDALLQETFGKEALRKVSPEIGHETGYGLQETIHMLVLLPIPARNVVRIESPQEGRSAEEVFLMEQECVHAPMRGINQDVGGELL
jgi:hypothetical protein